MICPFCEIYSFPSMVGKSEDKCTHQISNLLDLGRFQLTLSKNRLNQENITRQLLDLNCFDENKIAVSIYLPKAYTLTYIKLINRNLVLNICSFCTNKSLLLNQEFHKRFKIPTAYTINCQHDLVYKYKK